MRRTGTARNRNKKHCSELQDVVESIVHPSPEGTRDNEEQERKEEF